MNSHFRLATAASVWLQALLTSVNLQRLYSYQKLLYTFPSLPSSTLTLKVVYALSCARNSGDGCSGWGTCTASCGKRSPM